MKSSTDHKDMDQILRTAIALVFAQATSPLLLLLPFVEWRYRLLVVVQMLLIFLALMLLVLLILPVLLMMLVLLLYLLRLLRP
jgi:hypothetical protein